ncbi:MAG: non-ribosomal peptide synthetase, partial [Actinobacteria bacterium]|nr:non-ribosomal peptide synthetase [Actinomycetota bacterium]
KVDTGRLPVPQPAADSRGRPAAGATESALAAIWQEVLGLEQVGAEDNFFDLGGHSLLLGRVHQKIVAGLRPDLPLIALFQYPTIAALARHLAGDRDAEPAGAAPAARAEGQARLSRLRARR